MKRGTNYFPTYSDANAYYSAYLGGGARPTPELRRFVNAKLDSGEIQLGRPATKPGETLVIEDHRYHVVSK